MSMRDCPCSGYVVEIEKLIPCLPESQQTRAKDLLEAMESDLFGELFSGLVWFCLVNFPVH